MGKSLAHKKRALIMQTMLDGSPHWAGEWLPPSRSRNKNYGHWAIVLHELALEGLLELAGHGKASGQMCSDGRGKPRVLFRITPYGKEMADAIIAAGADE